MNQHHLHHIAAPPNHCGTLGRLGPRWLAFHWWPRGRADGQHEAGKAVHACMPRPPHRRRQGGGQENASQRLTGPRVVGRPPADISGGGAGAVERDVDPPSFHPTLGSTLPRAPITMDDAADGCPSASSSLGGPVRELRQRANGRRGHCACMSRPLLSAPGGVIAWPSLGQPMALGPEPGAPALRSPAGSIRDDLGPKALDAPVAPPQLN